MIKAFVDVTAMSHYPETLHCNAHVFWPGHYDFVDHRLLCLWLPWPRPLGLRHLCLSVCLVSGVGIIVYATFGSQLSYQLAYHGIMASTDVICVLFVANGMSRMFAKTCRLLVPGFETKGDFSDNFRPDDQLLAAPLAGQAILQECLEYAGIEVVLRLTMACACGDQELGK